MAAARGGGGRVMLSPMEKISSELFSLTYGALVAQLLKDYEDIDAVNSKLEQMGYNIGTRIVDEFLARNPAQPCRRFPESMEALGRVAFKMFLGVSADVTNWNADRTACSLTFAENPMTEFVELPVGLDALQYANILCGAIRGAMEMIQYRVKVFFAKDTLKGDPFTEIRIVLVERLADVAGDEYKDE